MKKASPKQVENISSALKRLTDDEEMGALFKVMAVVELGALIPPGFE